MMVDFRKSCTEVEQVNSYRTRFYFLQKLKIKFQSQICISLCQQSSNMKHPDWNHHKLSWSRTGRLCSRWLNPPRTSLVPSTEHQWHQCSEISVQNPEETKRQNPKRQSVHPAAIWQQIQKYLLLYHQTTQQLHSSDCETPQFNLCTQPKVWLLWCLHSYTFRAKT